METVFNWNGDIKGKLKKIPEKYVVIETHINDRENRKYRKPKEKIASKEQR